MRNNTMDIDYGQTNTNTYSHRANGGMPIETPVSTKFMEIYRSKKQLITHKLHSWVYRAFSTIVCFSTSSSSVCPAPPAPSDFVKVCTKFHKYEHIIESMRWLCWLRLCTPQLIANTCTHLHLMHCIMLRFHCTKVKYRKYEDYTLYRKLSLTDSKH